MLSESDRQYISSIARQAVNRIVALGLPFDPPMFELWFTYYKGHDRNFSAAIDDVLANDPALTHQNLLLLYESFLSPARLTEQARGIGEELQGQTSGALDAITAAAGSSQNFSDALVRATDRIKNADSDEGLRTAVADLLQSTSEAQRTNDLLQIRLSESAQQIRLLQQRLDLVRREALSDPLTGVGNRRMFDVSLSRLVDQADRDDASFSLILIDIDNFKFLNDTYGHLVGDGVLRLAASEIEQSCRASDVVCRNGGDEFAVILPNTPIEGALAVAEKIRERVMKRHLLKRSTQETMGRITASIGVAQHQKGNSPDALIARADKWLYAAKLLGRNRVSVDPSDLGEEETADIDRSQAGLQWSKAYESGDTLIDSQHRELIVLANALFDPNLKPESAPRELRSALDRLLAHVGRHFADEEAELSALNYHGLEWHKAAHTALLSDADQLRGEVQSGRKTLGDLREFIVNEVIAQHMLMADLQFFPLFRTSAGKPAGPGRQLMQ